jgi:hypothetical protein
MRIVKSSYIYTISRKNRVHYNREHPPSVDREHPPSVDIMLSSLC